MSCMCKGPHKLQIDHFLWSHWQAPPTLSRNQTLIVNPGFPLVGSTKVTMGSAKVKVHVQAKTFKSWVMIRSIYNPACVYLCQHVTKGGVDVVIPEEEPPSGWDFICKLPERWRKQEELELIIGIFDHACETHSHLTMVAANMSSLAKVADREMLQIVMKLAVHLLVQMNIPEGFLSPIQDKKPQTSEEEMLDKIQRTVLLRHKAACWTHEPKNGLMRILAVAVWLRLWRKYFYMGTAKEACELFQVRAKQFSRVLTGHKYLGGSRKKGMGLTEWGKKRKSVPSRVAVKKARKSKEEDDDDDNDDEGKDNGTWQGVKDRPH